MESTGACKALGHRQCRTCRNGNNWARRLIGSKPNRGEASPEIFRTLATFTWLAFLAVLTAACGGGPSSSTAVTPGTTPPPTQSAAASILTADAGGVCETLLDGEAYTRSPPPLACNGGTDPYTAYLDGSGSTTTGGDPLSYAWSFVSRPNGSNAALTGADTATPTFMPDKAGPYTVQLVVTANGVSSQRAVALVVALDDATLNPDPTTNPGAAAVQLSRGSLGQLRSVSHRQYGRGIQGKPSTHMATSDACQACHYPLAFNVTSFVDHAEVFGTCSTCHDGIVATGKSATHLVTTQECSDCHTTTSFVKLNTDGTFDHTGITAGCSACHNGTVAIGTASDPSPSGHPSISVECNACHTTATFTTPFPNHADPKVVVPGTCGQGGCHDGRACWRMAWRFTGKNSAPHPHPDTGNITQACDVATTPPRSTWAVCSITGYWRGTPSRASPVTTG